MKLVQSSFLLFGFTLLIYLPSFAVQVGWKQQSTSYPDTTAFTSICFSGDNVGIIVGGSNAILHTNNGGQSWDSSATQIPQDILLTCVCHVNGRSWVAVGDRVIYRSENDGQTWLPLWLDYRTQLDCVTFVDSLKGFACGLNGVIATTFNGGIDWNIDTLNTDYDMSSVKFYNDRKGMIVGQDGLILRTDDSGLTWNKLTTSNTNNIDDIDMIDSSTAVLCGWGGLMMKTIDFGDNWTTLNLSTHQYLHSIIFPTSTSGYVVGYGGFIAATSDAGFTWEVQESGTLKALHSVFAVDSANLYAVGAKAIILHTETGGIVYVADSLTSGKRGSYENDLLITIDSYCNIHYVYHNKENNQNILLHFYDLNGILLNTVNLKTSESSLPEGALNIITCAPHCIVLAVVKAGIGTYHVLLD